MPEYPEVYTIITDLRKILIGSTIINVLPREGYIISPSNEVAIKQLVNSKITKIDQIAKNIIVKTETGYINIHLAMTGQILAKKSEKPMRWERVCFEIKKGKKTFFIAFRDMRMFGKVRFLEEEELENLKFKYGVNPLTEEVKIEKFTNLIRSKNTKIKNLLMEQEKISGLGNIYTTEALFLAGIHPETRTLDLNTEQIKLLLVSIINVLKEGINNRGTTLADEMFIDVFGNKGKNQDFLNIYNKKSCPKCGTKIESVKITGRNSYFCPKCQPKLNPGESKLGPIK